MSRILAVLRGSRLKRLLMSRAMPPVVIIATVLFAVQRLDSDTRAAILSSAPLFPLILVVRPLTMKSNPPLARMISSIPPAIMVTMMRSPIPLIPVPMALRYPLHESHPPVMPIMPLSRSPIVSTAVTLTPAKARIITEI